MGRPALDGERLDLRLLHGGGERELVIRVVQVEVEVGWVERGGGFRIERASLDFQVAERLKQCAAGDHVGGHGSARGRRLAETGQQLFNIEVGRIDVRRQCVHRG